MKKRLNRTNITKPYISDVSLVDVICDNVLQESSALSVGEIRKMLYDAIDLNRNRAK